MSSSSTHMPSNGASGSLSGTPSQNGDARPSHPSHRSDAGPSFAIPKAMVCFTLAGRNYGIDVALVREVVNVERLLTVPKSPTPIAGAFALRGATLALVDTRILFGLVSPSERNQALIIARGHRVLCGLTIDSVLGVMPFDTAKFTAAVRGQDPAQVAGFFDGDQLATITVLDTGQLLQLLDRLRF